MSEMMKLKYGTREHQRVRDALVARLQISEQRMSQRHTQFSKNEEKFIAYIPETEANAHRRLDREAGKPRHTTFEIPYSFALVLTAHMYWCSVFLSRNPILQVLGRHGEGQWNEMAVEALLDYQIHVGRNLIPLYNWLLDAPKYGLGVLGAFWDDEIITCSEIVEENETWLGVPIPGKTKKVRKVKQLAGYQGMRLFNIRPYHFFPDPRVPISRLQDGEFVGWYTEFGWNELLRRQLAGQAFNMGAAAQQSKARQAGNDSDWGSEKLEWPDPDMTADTIDVKDTGFLKGHQIYVDLVPRDWGLGESSNPEKWFFTLVNKEVIVCARPAGSYHNRFPVFVNEYEIDAYQLSKRSMFEILEPLNNTLTWLFDSHYVNVRKVVNDQFVIDPSKLMMSDVLKSDGGRMWRLRPEFWGTDPSAAVHQMQVVDVTQNHMKDASIVMDLMNRVSSVNENIMGIVNPGGRKTASEIRSANSLGVNRLKTIAEYNSALGWEPMTQVMIQETQQRMDAERMYRVAGSSGQDKVANLKVGPDDIAGFFDFIPVDGTLPVDRMALANLHREMLKDAASIPALAGQVDLLEMLKYTWELLGVKTFDKFRIQPRIQVRPDGQIEQQAQAGNIVPLQGAPNGPRPTGPAPAAGGRGGNPERPPVPRQLSGMGPTQ